MKRKNPRPSVRRRKAPSTHAKDPFLVSLGERVRLLRARRGITRRGLATEARVSERHLANLETGMGNASVLVLRQIAGALGATLAELLGDETTRSPEWLLIRELLRSRSDEDLKRGRLALADLYAVHANARGRHRRIALIGLRGAGKSTLGRMLADDLELPFIELSREIERVAGCGLDEVHALYGPSAYRRYERRALQEVVAQYPEAVIATPGGVVADAATFNLLLARCFTVWLQATPEEHMTRVVAQGDLRPMSGNAEAMEDLKRILSGRHSFYAQADLRFSTSGADLHEAFASLRAEVRRAIGASVLAAA